MELGQLISWVVDLMDTFGILGYVQVGFGFVVLLSVVAYVTKILRG